MTGVRFDSIDEYNDIAMRNKYKEEVKKGRDPEQVFEELLLLSRDNSRTPIQWDDSEQAGFTTGTPWIKVNPNYREIHVAKAMEDPQSVFYFYKKLIALRKENPVMIYGDYQDFSDGDDILYVYTRTYQGQRWLILLNHSDTSSAFTLSDQLDDSAKQLILSNYQDVTTSASIKQVTLRPHEARIYQL
ncbi:alpha-glucosidase C-terminal domain-containing protein [Aquibacillus albus]|uniref:Glycosidase n=1 Tax=Aquibacillus albus TaxID=1168171 RepID=A0ABS2MY62_9BACI|nr:alpha-glucosidase C-terminal domain-containing protein [Aquibacillus albus]MBM7570822.1 glycosidase [Aquibacillus albus]